MHRNDYEGYGYDDTYRRTGHFLNDAYTTKRVDSALGYLTPKEFEVLHEVQQLP